MIFYSLKTETEKASIFVESLDLLLQEIASASISSFYKRKRDQRVTHLKSKLLLEITKVLFTKLLSSLKETFEMFY